MWQRGGSRQPAISAPYQFVELDCDQGYYDDRYLETIHEVDSISSRRQSIQYGLPELPFRSVPPMNEIPHPVNINTPTEQTEIRPAQHHGLRVNVNAVSQADSAEVSPLTPRNSQRRQTEDEQPISPIDHHLPTDSRAPAPLPSQSMHSQIPRKVHKSKDGNMPETKWDAFSGEPTTDDKGKPASTRPGTQPVEMNYPNLKDRTKQILAGLREREAANKQKWGRNPPPVADDARDHLPERQPWRGPSGRAAIVQPVKTTVVARKNVPPPIQVEEQTHNTTPVYHGAVTQPQSQAILRQMSSEESIKPLVPLKPRNFTPDVASLSPTLSVTDPTPVQSPLFSAAPEVLCSVPTMTIAERLPSRGDSPTYDLDPATPTTPEIPILSTPEKFGSSPPVYTRADMEREVSHFSWTTYTESTSDSPRSMAQIIRDSSPPPMQDLPDAILIKKRPVSTSPFMPSRPYMTSHFADSTGSVVRKPVPGDRSSSISSAVSRAMSTSKSLPPTPTVMEAGDKIENLEAQLESLKQRRYNISRIIANLQANMKKNAVIYNMWQRKEVEKNITNHRMSLDDISSEIHDLSLQLHRAERKRDERQGREASSLWIKRVTS